MLWKVKSDKLEKNKIDFVIGVAKGKVLGYFKIITINKDYRETDRVNFILENCSENEISDIKDFIISKTIKYFVVKYKW